MIAAAALALAACAATPPRGVSPVAETLLDGETMGSAWTVKIAGPLPSAPETLRAGIQAQFDAVNLALSTWRPDSALSRFNSEDRGEWVDIDPELALVMGYALGLSAESDGAYDVTVGPLVNLWGFGPDPATHRVPEAAAIEAARLRVGWRQVEVDVPNHRARKRPGVRVDLSSLGKGRGVDRVAGFLDSQGIGNYLIDLSGKLRARGRNAAGTAWRVAVERPAADAGSDAASLQPAVVALHDESIATAGDYRRFFETGGRHYSHIIDPRTGQPVSHHTVSSTVMAADCMQADAWATVLMVMDPAAARSLAERLGLRALLIAREPPGFKQTPSPAWHSRGL